MRIELDWNKLALSLLCEVAPYLCRVMPPSSGKFQDLLLVIILSKNLMLPKRDQNVRAVL